MKTIESCSCGGTIDTDDSQALTTWREAHSGCQPVPPGPCWNDSGVILPNSLEFTYRCDLLAGHEGAHQADRGPWSGEAIWPSSDDERAEAVDR